MRLLITTGCLLLAGCACPAPARAQLELVADKPAQEVFAGNARLIRVVFHNAAATPLDMDLRTQLYQAEAATVVPIGAPRFWKRLQLSADQTVLESLAVDLPDVKGEAKFLLQWLADSNRVVGLTELRVYPTNLLAELKPLLSGRPLGLLDPQNQLKPLLKGLNVDFVDLAEIGLENFAGGLGIIGPFQSKGQMSEGLADDVRALSSRKVPMVWLLPPPEKRDNPVPSFYSVTENSNAVVVVQPGLVADLAENPRAQLDLVYFCKLALRPEPLRLPGLTVQP